MLPHPYTIYTYLDVVSRVYTSCSLSPRQRRTTTGAILSVFAYKLLQALRAGFLVAFSGGYASILLPAGTTTENDHAIRRLKHHGTLLTSFYRDRFITAHTLVYLNLLY
jgi:hypothetical protein